MFVSCRARLSRALLLGRILWQLGYVRVAYGALNVERQYSSEVVQNCFSPVEIPQVQFLVCGVLPVVAEGRGDSTGAVPGRGCLHA